MVQLTGSDGNVTKSYDYDAYGNEKNPDAADANPFRYCGEYFDKETGTYYLRARYYAPGIGRFISEDSYWGKDNDPLSLNLYTYCENEPINRIDPSGHDWLDKVIDSILNFFGISSDLDETATGPHSDMYKISTAFYWGIQTDITFFCMNYTQAFFDTIEWAAQQDAITTAISPVKQNLNSLSKGAAKTNNVKVNAGQQNKHIPGTNNYKQEIANGKTKSILSEDPQSLLDEFAGTGQKIGTNKERVDFGKTIGQYYDSATGTYTNTTKGIIHYDSKGQAHIVPARP
mgnify:CR=1 FL=1